MRFSSILRVGTAAFLLMPGLVWAGDKDKKDAAQMVDSGTLGVFINGHRVATETFSESKPRMKPAVTNMPWA